MVFLNTLCETIARQIDFCNSLVMLVQSCCSCRCSCFWMRVVSSLDHLLALMASFRCFIWDSSGCWARITLQECTWSTRRSWSKIRSRFTMTLVSANNLNWTVTETVPTISSPNKLARNRTTLDSLCFVFVYHKGDVIWCDTIRIRSRLSVENYEQQLTMIRK